MAEYIDKGTAIAKLTTLEVTEPNATMTSAKRLLADMPAADVAPVVHGRGISKNPHGYEWTFVCLNCGYVDSYPFNDRRNYCPNCGAKMGGRGCEK